MMFFCIDTGVEMSSEIPHHSHSHSWCYLLDFFLNCLLSRHLQALAIQVVLFFNVDPVVHTESTHLKIVFQLGTLARRPS